MATRKLIRDVLLSKRSLLLPPPRHRQSWRSRRLPLLWDDRRRYSVFSEFSKKVKGEAVRNQEFQQSVKELKEKAVDLKGVPKELKEKPQQKFEQLFKLVNEVNKQAAAKKDEFQSIYSQAASCGGGSQSSPMDPAQEDKIRKQSWLTAAGGKNSKGRLYGVGKVSQGYQLGDRITEAAHSVSDSEKILELEQQVHESTEEARKSREEARQSREENERLNRKLQSLISVVLPFLPPTVQIILPVLYKE
ncbi:hypothetical protein Fmac_010254 [Flemingia macrophylla]|uniref:Uncharacterized protein n=1 Tax=Flemingia macrophylla TaxID=520843 RepID=A0ABD1MJW5_9FABA